MEIRFENKEAFVVTGYAVETSHATNETDLGALWDEYNGRLASASGGGARLYGVMWYTENQSYYYLLGVERRAGVSLEGASTSIEIPAAQYAVAAAPGGMPIIEAWTAYIQKELPERGYIPDAGHGKYFEFYDENGACELWTPVQRSGEAGARDEVEACEERLRASMCSGDVAALGELLADDMEFVNHFGRRISKADDIAAHRQGMFKVGEIRVIARNVRVMGESAVTLTEASVSAVNGEAMIDHLIYTRVWRKRGRAWQLAAGQATRVE